MPASPDPAAADLTAEIAALIAAEGPIPVERFMALANAHYYATRDPLGPAGDFVTAPEISQMFGELIGLALADAWQRAGAPAGAHYVELGPGRGTLAADALRAMDKAGLAPPVHLVETSPLLRAAQRERLPAATWHDDIATVPKKGPLLIVANEFFDALPVRQFVQTVAGWRERMIADGPAGFEIVPGSRNMDGQLPLALLDAEPGSVFERAPATIAAAEALGRRLAAQGGVLIACDYGYHGRAAGDTLQAVHAHAYADPVARPGASDLTAHVDFAALAAAAKKGGAKVHGPVDQGQWLVALGIGDRAAKLGRAHPERGGEIATAYRRLTHEEEMGTLFKVIAVTGKGWPAPGGFA